jgi:hypothetical protein
VERIIQNIDLSDGRLAGVDLPGVTFISCDLNSVDFTGANLEGAVFIHCDLRYALLTMANLRGASFDGVDLGNADLQRLAVRQPPRRGPPRRWAVGDPNPWGLHRRPHPVDGAWPPPLRGRSVLGHPHGIPRTKPLTPP